MNRKGTPQDTLVWRWTSVLPIVLAALLFVALWALVSLPGLGAPVAGATWSDFRPAGWITQRPVTLSVSVDAAEGLRPRTAAYQTTVDGGVTWSSWLTSSITVAQPVTTQLHITVSRLSWPDGATDNAIRFRVQRDDGITETSPIYTLPVDTRPPAVRVTSPPSGVVTESFTIAGTASDATSGVARVDLQLQDVGGRYWNGIEWGTAPAWLTATGTLTWTYAGSLPPWADGTYTVRARAQDNAGWQTETDPVTATIDLSAPAAPQNAHIEPPDWTRTNAFTLTWSNPEDPAGIAGAFYKVGDAPAAPDDGTFVAGRPITTIHGITVPVEGVTPIYLWLKDGLGHADPTQTARLDAHYDATPPGAPTDLVATPGGWQSINDFSLTWSNPADLSGIAGAYYRFNSEPASPRDGTFVPGDHLSHIEHIQVPGEGIFDVYLWLVDKAGNVDQRKRNVLTEAFKYDATPPTVSLNITGTLGQHGWYTSPLTITFQARDTLSGLANVQYRVDKGPWMTGDFLSFSAEGRHALTYLATDRAGNQSDPMTQTVAVDYTPPTLHYTLPPLPAGEAWYKHPITVSVQVDDPVSGLREVSYRLDEGPWLPVPESRAIEIITDGRHHLLLRARDQAGNVSQVGPIEIPIDRTAPVTAYVVDGFAGDGRWYISPVTVTLTPTDTASGVVATYYKVDDSPWQEGTQFTISDDGQHTIQFYSVDAAGWQEQGFPTPIWIDTTPPPPPPLLWAVPDTWTNRNHFQVQWATPSDLSQVVGAYYKLDAPPESVEDGTYVPGGRSIPDIQVPDEGAHTVYVWLRDGAGNINVETPAILENGLLYDESPPITHAVLHGLRGNGNWWRSPVTVTLVVTDAFSGPDTTYAAVDGGVWQQTRSFVIKKDDKHDVEFYSTDKAGNQEGTRHQTVRIDTQAPPTPDDMSIVSQGWQHENHFLVRWTPPIDLSGISGIRYTINRPPRSPDDGTFSPGTDTAFIQVPSEGIFDAYIWIVDGAGNGNPDTARYFPRSLWFDNTPPTLDVHVSGKMGENGWYVGPVQISANTQDTASGEATAWMQVDDQTPISLTHPFVLAQEGTYHVRVWAVDAAGNRTDAWQRTIHIDLHPPRVAMVPLPVYLTDFTPLQGGLVSFRVRWQGDDGPDGSGVADYLLQVKEGINGRWTVWLPQTQKTSGLFIGEMGHTYFFRVRARDRAGHESSFPSSPYGHTYTHVETVRNGHFATGNLLYWMGARVPQPGVGGTGLSISVKNAAYYAGGESLAVWLGDPEYGGAEQPGLVPIGGAVISQTVTVPALSQMAHPTLEFWYHMITWDVRYSPSHKRWQDTFELRILSPTGQEQAHPLRAGYETRHIPPQKYVDFAVKHDLGWRRYRYDLRPYAGQTIILEFSTWNRWDNQYNTYTILDDVRIVDPTLTPHQFLPMVLGAGSTPAPTPTPTPTPVTITKAGAETLER